MTREMKIGRRGILALGTGLCINSAFDPFVRAATSATQVVKTTNGPVRGTVEAGVQTFRGLRYGATTAGAGRFMPPRKPTPWTAMAEATQYGHATMQFNAAGNVSVQRPLVDKALHEILLPPDDVRTQSEDCLFLNVWTPQLGGKRPVMMWIHGGGFDYGSASWHCYDGHNLAARHDVVLVGVNHRLNFYGNLYLGGSATGNVGQLDLVAALEWIRDNIAEFGGDPGNVTIFGQSGGGRKVTYLLTMPSAKGLFHKAIIESGAQIRGVSKDAATQNADAVYKIMKVAPGDIKALQAIPADKFTKALEAASAPGANGARGLAGWNPVTDGSVVPEDPFVGHAPSVSANIPLIIGSNKDERTLYNTGMPWWGKMTKEESLARAKKELGKIGDKAEALYAAFEKIHPDYSPTYLYNAVTTSNQWWFASIKIAEERAAQRQASTWNYHFEWETPVDGGILKSPHTMEMVFVFDNIEKAPTYVGKSAGARQLADLMSGTWATFAKTGNPNHSGMPDWPAYDARTRATMALNVQSKVVHDQYGEARKILDS